MNDFKGQRGGDPSMRPRKIEFTYRCLKCERDSTVVIDEGKESSVASRPCQKCQDLINIKNHVIAQEKTRARIRRNEETFRTRPIRTEEQMKELLEQYKDHPHETCQGYCKRSMLVFDEQFPFAYDDFQRQNAIETVMYVSDPVESEIYEDYRKYWLCDSCYSAKEEDL